MCREARRNRRRAAALACLLAPAAVAAGPPPAEKDHWTFSVLFENDLFGNTDENYTNGAKLSWVSPDVTDYVQSGNLPGWLRPVTDHMPFVHEPGLRRTVGLALGQKIFTPRATEQSALIEDDRPYAGWLYLGTTLNNKNERRLDSMELQLGVIGPAALGEQAQNGVHRLRDIDEARGWDNQLHNELGVAFIYEHKDRFPLGRERGWGGDVITHYGGALGNVFTYANLGAEARWGWNPPTDFGTSLIRPGGEANAPVDSSDPRLGERPDFGVYGFGAVSGRWVLRDIFLDGNTFGHSHSVDKNPLVGDLILGIGLTWHRAKLTYAQVFRTEEFQDQPRNHNFGSLSVSWTY